MAENIGSQTDKKTQFFSKNHPKKPIFKDIRAQTVKYTANLQLVSEQKIKFDISKIF